MTMRIVASMVCVGCDKQTTYKCSIAEARVKYAKTGGTIQYKKRKGSRKIDNFATCGKCNVFLKTGKHPDDNKAKPVVCPKCKCSDINSSNSTGTNYLTCCGCTHRFEVKQ